MKKINGKVITIITWSLVIGLLVYSRFINLGWGLPYPMHPDERNMVDAIGRLRLADNFNPHFFAYGQLPLYLGYLISYVFKTQATLSLRIISAIASIINAVIIIKIIKVILKKDSELLSAISYPIIIFSPYAIQFAHFGTTESLLMMFYSLSIYYCLLFIQEEIHISKFIILNSLVCGLALATKVSSAIFLAVPVVVLMSHLRQDFGGQAKRMTIFSFLTLFFAILFSPHNLINFQDFISSMNYESDVALGKSLVFYTRQFFNTEPFYFQLTRIFPYTFGWGIFILGSLGFVGLSWKDKKINLLRFAFLIYFIPTAIIYAKWSRFMSPVFPIVIIFSTLFLYEIFTRVNKKLLIFVCMGMTALLIIPGISYLSIYQNPDIRFQASKWIYKNIPENSYILSETANVVDIPLEVPNYNIHKNYQVISFNFYDLDESPELQQSLKNHLQKADYIFVPSRRIFANSPKEKYPILNKYYEDLFSGKLGFRKVAELFTNPDDENAEETWTVFDHPVIRIYKRVTPRPF